MPQYRKQISEVVEDYIRPKGNKADLIEIYERVFDDYDPEMGVAFKSIDEGRKRLNEKDWDSELFEEFVNAVREVMDSGAGAFPESYFDIVSPDNLTLDRLEYELEQKPYRPDAPGEERDGFEYEVDDSGVVHATWYYTQISRGLTGTGTVQETTSEQSIRFRIHPSRDLLVVESTYPINIQKMKRIISEETPNLKIDVTGVDPTDEDIDFEQRIKAFRDSFDRPDNGGPAGGDN